MVKNLFKEQIMDSKNKRSHYKTKKPHVLCGFLPTEVVRTGIEPVFHP